MRTIAATVSILLAALMLAGTSAAETPLERGTYLMESVAACPICHTPWDEDGQIADMHFAGGLAFEEDEYTAYASNITPDWDTGLGRWNSRKMRTAITKGLRPDGGELGPPMPYERYDTMDRQDLSAILAYVRSLPQIENDTD